MTKAINNKYKVASSAKQNELLHLLKFYARNYYGLLIFSVGFMLFMLILAAFNVAGHSSSMLFSVFYFQMMLTAIYSGEYSSIPFMLNSGVSRRNIIFARYIILALMTAVSVAISFSFAWILTPKEFGVYWTTVGADVPMLNAYASLAFLQSAILLLNILFMPRGLNLMNNNKMRTRFIFAFDGPCMFALVIALTVADSPEVNKEAMYIAALAMLAFALIYIPFSVKRAQKLFDRKDF